MLNMLFRQFHSIPPGEDFYKQALSLYIFTLLNLPGVGVSWNVFTGAGSWLWLLCGSVINFLSREGQEAFLHQGWGATATGARAGQHEHHLLQRSRIYPGFTPHHLPDRNSAIKNQMLIENISFPTISNEYLKLLLERKILNIYFFFPHRQMLVEIANTKKKY